MIGPDTGRIIKLTLDERTVIRRSPEVEQERRVAIYDLIEENQFVPDGIDAGPYSLHLRLEENRLLFDICDAQDQSLTTVTLALTPFRNLLREYFMICESYFQAIKTATPSRIETLDMARRGIHDEGSELLRERLAGKITTDFGTARRLFTLICVLHIRG